MVLDSVLDLANYNNPASYSISKLKWTDWNTQLVWP